ncbi:MAG: hypothetical protein JW915_23650 [Chitinispirillaceae bacterium]|nr:hypothetical protein [Chitinispirillaceae bacterium]
MKRKEDRVRYYLKLNSSEFDDTDFEHVVFISEQIEIENVERQTETYKSAAYNHWLTGAVKKEFNAYCIELGLSPKKSKKMSKRQKEKKIKRADELAEKIMKAEGKQ